MGCRTHGTLDWTDYGGCGVCRNEGQKRDLAQAKLLLRPPDLSGAFAALRAERAAAEQKERDAELGREVRRLMCGRTVGDFIADGAYDVLCQIGAFIRAQEGR